MNQQIAVRAVRHRSSSISSVSGSESRVQPPPVIWPARRQFPFAAYFLGAVISGSALLLAADAEAGPTGGVVVGGSGTIGSSGNTTTINQTSQRLSLNWQTFNLNANETVNFLQPSASSVALNRILDQKASQIFGQINANGQVFLINTHGILFGATAKVNVAGLLASSLDLSSDDFQAGRYQLDARGGLGAVVNHGILAAANGGTISLVGSKVVNDGLIVANYGRINLDAADRAFLDFDGNGLINIEVTGELRARLDAAGPAVSNTGELRAQGGTVVLQASAARDLFTNLVNNSGLIDAGGISDDGGVVRLVASGGNVEHSGRIDASGSRGGDVQVLGDRDVLVTGSAVIDASGRDGGGKVRIGGGLSGGEGLVQAERALVAPDAVITADASGNGNGGSVVVYSKDNTVIAGTLSAQGGLEGGNGGFVETSSGGGFSISSTPKVSARTVNGIGGEWLIDPYNVTIVATGGNNTYDNANPFNATANNTSINVALLISALNGGNTVTVSTGAAGSPGTDAGDITLATQLNYNGTGNGTLNLNAANDILINAAILDGTAGGDSLNLNLQAGRSIALNANIDLGAGDATLNATTGAITRSAGTTLTADDLTARADSGISLMTNVNSLNVINNGATGNIDITEVNGLTVAMLRQSNAANVTGTVSLISNGGNLMLNNGAVLSQGGLITLTATAGAISDNDGGTAASITNATGNAVLTARDGIGAAGAGAIDTDLAGLSASVTGTGLINVAEANAITLNSIRTINGDVTVSAGGELTATLVVAAGNNRDVTLTTSAGNLIAGAITADGDAVTLTSAGSILDDAIDTTLIDANTVNLTTAGAASTIGSAGGATTSGIPLGYLDFTGLPDINLNGAPAGAFVRFVTTTNVNAGASQLNELIEATQDIGIAVDGADFNFNTTRFQDIGTRNLSVIADGITLGLLTQQEIGTSGDVLLRARDGSIVDSVEALAAADVRANSLTLEATQGIGNGTGGAIETDVASLNASVTGTGSLSIIQSNALLLNSATTVNGAISITTSVGNLSVGAVSAGAGAGAAGQGNVSLTATAGSITEATPDAAVDIAGGNVTLAAANGVGTTTEAIETAATTLSATSSGAGSINLAELDGVTLTSATTSDGSIAVTAGGSIVATTVAAGSGTVSLTADGATSDIIGTTLSGTTINLIAGRNIATGAVTAANDLATSNTGTLSYGTLNLGGNLTSTTSGAVTQTGAVSVNGTSNIDAGSSTITLTSATNNFIGAVSLAGGNVSIRDANQLTLGTLDTADLSVQSAGALNLGAGSIAGNLVATSGGNAITQSGALTVAGTSALTASGAAITLNNVGNDFDGAVSVTGAATTLVDANAIVLGDSTVSGALNVTSNGNITQTGAIAAATTTTLNAGIGNVTLANAANNFTGAVSATGNAISLRDTNDLTVSTLANSANGAVSLIAGGNLTLPAGAISTGTADLVLAANGGSFSTGGSLSGANISLTARDALGIGHAVTTSGALTLTSTTGAINQTAATITAGTVTGSSSGTTTLGQANNITNLGPFTATGFQLLNASALNVSGAVTGGTGNTSLRAQAGNLSVGTGGSVAGNAVTLRADAGAITQAAGTAVNATTLNVQAANAVALNSTANQIATLSGAAFTSSLDINSGRAFTVASMIAATNGETVRLSTAGGTGNSLTITAPITITGGAGGTLQLASAGNLILSGNVGGGTVDLQSGAAITQTGSARVTAGTLTGSAVGNATLNQATNAVSTLGTFTTGAGFSLVSAASPAVAGAPALTVSGTVSGGTSTTITTTTGDLRIEGLVSGTAINLSATTGAIVDGNGNARNVSGGTLTALALTGIDFDTDIAALDASVTGAGAISIDELNTISLTDVDTANGNIAITAGGTLTATDVAATNGTVSLSATGTGSDLAAGIISGTAVSLNAGRAITDGNGTAVNVTTAGVLTADAVTGVDLDTAVARLDASVSGVGAIAVDQTGAIQLDDIDTANGDVRVTASGTITALDVAATGGTARLIANGAASNLVVGTIGGSNVVLAAGRAITDGNGAAVNVSTGLLTADAVTGINLDTSVASLNASVSGAGNLVIREANAITLTDIDTANGNIDVTALGAITASYVAATGGTVALTASGATSDIVGGVLRGNSIILNAGRDLSTGTISNTGNLTTMNAGSLVIEGVILTGNLVANNNGAVTQTGALVVAGTSQIAAGAGAITLGNAGNDFGGAVTASGSAVTLADLNAITLANVTTTAGSAVVTAGSTITATRVEAGGTGDIQLTSTGGNVDVDTLVALDDDVRLSALAGQIRDINGAAINVSAANLVADAATGIDLDTSIASLDASVNGTGNLAIDDADAVSLTDVSTNAGNITINAGGTITATSAVARGGNLNLSANGVTSDIVAGVLGGTLVNLTAGRAIGDGNGGSNNVTATQLNATAAAGIALGTDVDVLDVRSTGAAGDIAISNVGTVAVQALQAAGTGSVQLSTGGGGDIALRDGSVLTQGGAVALSAAGAIVDADGGNITSIVTNGGNLVLDAATGIGDADAIDTEVATLAFSNGANAVRVIDRSSAGLTVRNSLSNNGAIELTSTGVGGLTLAAGNSLQASGGAISLSATAANAGLVIGGQISTIYLGASGSGVTLVADNLDLTGATIAAGNGTVAIRQTTNGRAISLGTEQANELSLSDAELDTISAATLAVGDGNSGDLSLRNAISLGNVATLALTTGAAITTANAGGPDVTVANLIATAASGFTLNTAVGSLDASVTGSGNIVINELDAIRLVDVDTANGSITINAGGRIAAADVAALGGNVSLTATGAASDLEAGSISGNNVLLSAGRAITDGNGTATNISATRLTADAATGIDLDTAIAELDASVSGTGALLIRERDAITLIDVDTAAGGIAVTAGSTLTASDVAATGGNVDLTANGAGSDFIGGVVSGINVSLTAGGNLSTGSVTASGNIAASSAGNLRLDTITQGGNLLASTQNGTITQTAALVVGGSTTLDAGAAAITLNRADNDFQGVVNIAGANATIVDANNLTLGTLTTGNLNVTSTGALNLGSGSVAGLLSAASNGGAITQTGALNVTGASAINAGSGTITLANAGNDFQSQVVATGSAISLRDANSLDVRIAASGAVDVRALSGALTVGGTAAALTTFSGTGTRFETLSVASVDSAASGAITQGGAITVAGNAALNAGGNAIDLSTAGNDFGGVVTASGSNIALRDANDLVVGNLDAGGVVALTAGGTLTQAASTRIAAGTLSTASGLATTLTNANLIGQLGDVTANGFSLSNAQALTVDGVVNAGASGNLTTTAGDLAINNTVTATNLVLTSAGAISEGVGGRLVATNLSGQSVGATSLAGNNSITNLAGFTAAGFTLNNAQALNVTAAVNGGSGVALTTTSGGIAIGASITGADTRLNSAAGITQTAGTVNAVALTATAVGGIALNTAVTTADLASTGSGSISVTELDSITLGTVNTNSGDIAVTAGGALTSALLTAGGDGDVSLDARAGSLSVGTINADGNEVSLSASTFVVQAADGVITAGGVSGTGPSGFSLTGQNRIDRLHDVTAGNLSVRNVTDLRLEGPINVSPTGDVMLQVLGTGNDLTILSDISAGSISARALGELVLGASLSASDSIGFDAGTITQNSGIITTPLLRIAAGGRAVLDGANRIDALGPVSVGSLSLTNAQSLAVNGPLVIGSGAGDLSLRTTAGSLSINTEIVADDIALNSATDLLLSNAVTGNTLDLRSGGAISQTSAGILDVVVLTGSSVGSTTLNAANLIDTLGGFTAANLSLSNSQALTVNGALTIGGGLGDLSLRTSAGGLTVNTDIVADDVGLASATDLTLIQTVVGNTVSLDAGGDIAQTANGVIDTGLLNLRSGGDTRLTGANRIDALGTITAANLTLNNAQSLAVNGPLTVGVGGVPGDLSLSTSAGTLTINTALTADALALGSATDLVLANAVTANSVSLTSGGTITQTAAGIIDTALLTGQSAGDSTLTAANRIDVLGNYSAPNLNLSNAQALIVNGTLSNGLQVPQRVRLATTVGGLTVNSALTAVDIALDSAADLQLTRAVNAASTLDLRAAGNLGQTAEGVIEAAQLSGRIGGNATLEAGNRIGTLRDFSAADLSLVNGQRLTVGSGVAIGDGAGDLRLQTTTGDIDVQGDLAVRNLDLASAADLILTSNLSADTSRLVAASAITQAGNAGLTTRLLTGSAGGVAALTGANAIAELASFTANGLDLVNTRALTISGPVDGGVRTTIRNAGDLNVAGDLRGVRTALDVTGSVVQTAGVITAEILSGQVSGSATLDGLNDISRVDTFTAQGLSLSSAANGSLTINNVDGGNRTVITARASDLVLGTGTVRGVDVSLTAGGAIIGTVDSRVEGQSLTTVSGDRTVLNTAVDHYSGLVTGVGDLTINERDGITLDSVTAADGNIRILTREAGDVTATDVTAQRGNVQIVVLNESSELAVGSIAGNSVSLQAGAIVAADNDASADIRAANITLASATGIGTGSQGAIDLTLTGGGQLSASAFSGGVYLDSLATTAVTVANLTARNGDIRFNQTGNQDLKVIRAENQQSGSTTIQNDGARLTVENATIGAFAGNTLPTVQLSSAGDLIVGTVVGGARALLQAGGAITALSNSLDAGVIGLDVVLEAGRGIGNDANGALNVYGATLSATSVNGNIDLNSQGLSESGTLVVSRLATGIGSITLDQTGGQALMVQDASTADGAISISNAEGQLTVNRATAGGSDASDNLTLLTTGSGDIAVGDVQALGNDVRVTAGGSIITIDADAAADISAANVLLTAGSGIGNGANGALGVSTGNLTARSTNGNIDLDSLATSTVTVAELRTGNGTIRFDQTGGQALNVSSASTGNGAIAISNDRGTLTVTAADVGGTDDDDDLQIATTGSGNLVIGELRALGNDALLSSAGAIVDSNGAAVNVTADRLVATAVTGIGAGGDALETAVAALSFDTASGDVAIGNAQAQGVVVDGSSRGGSIVVTETLGNLTVGGDISASGNTRLTASAGSILRIAGTVRGGTVTLIAGGSGTAGGSIGGSIGGNRAPIVTDADAIVFTGAGSGSVDISEINGATISGSTGSGDIRISAAAGNLVVGGNVGSTGNTALTASSGSILRAAGTVSGGTVTLTAGGANGAIGAAGAAILTDANAVAFLGTGSGTVDIVDANGAGFSGATGSGNIALATQTGDLTVAGDIATRGDASLTATAGSLQRTGGTVRANALSLIAGGSNGGIGSVAAPVLTDAATIAFTGNGSGAINIVEANGASIRGSTGSGDIRVESTSGDLTVDGAVSTGGDARLTAGRDLALNAAVSADEVVLNARGGAIRQSNAGVITADTLSGSSQGATSLLAANRIDRLGAFTTNGFALSNAQALTVASNAVVDGGTGNVALTTTQGGIAIDGTLRSQHAVTVDGTVTLNSAGTIVEGVGGRILADVLTGRSLGSASFGSENSFIANRVGTVSQFQSRGTFSLTTEGTLGIFNLDATGFTTYLGVIGGDLLQLRDSEIRNTTGRYFVPDGGIGRRGNGEGQSLRVTGTGNQTIIDVRIRPAYVTARTANGTFLLLDGVGGFNSEIAGSTGSAQQSNNVSDSYIDPALISARFRTYGIVPSGMRLPEDQIESKESDDE